MESRNKCNRNKKRRNSISFCQLALSVSVLRVANTILLLLLNLLSTFANLLRFGLSGQHVGKKGAQDSSNDLQVVQPFLFGFLEHPRQNKPTIFHSNLSQL